MRQASRRFISLATVLILSSNVVLPAFASVPTNSTPTPPRTKFVPRAPIHSKGTLTLSPNSAVATERPPTHRGFETLLDEVGAITPGIAAFNPNSSLRILAGHPTGLQKSQAAIRVGEYELAVRQAPETAIERFKQALSGAPKGTTEHGLARYDMALAYFYSGRYRESQDTIKSILNSTEVGYNRRDAAMFLRHATVCAGYHEARSAVGITEPARLDPLCGAAAMATALRHLSLRHDEAFVASKVKHTGEGSSLEDLQNACRSLGVIGYPVSTTKKGLIAMFQASGRTPIVAHVEHDHFIAVVDATDRGVKYMCSDCGPWPGGAHMLPWKQWNLMEADAFLAIGKPGTPYAAAMDSLVASKTKAKGKELSLLSISPLSTLAEFAPKAPALATMLAGNINFLIPFPTGAIVCGQKPESTHCPPDGKGPNCPSDCGPGTPGGTPGGGGAGGQGGPQPKMAAFASGPTAGDPVNLATGEEEYAPPVDLKVYNPTGPSVNWRRAYYSLSNSHSGFGQSWTHPYNVSIQESKGVVVIGPPSPTLGGPGSAPSPAGAAPVAGGNFFVVYDNGAKAKFTPSTTTPPTAASPHVSCTVPPGTPFGVSWDWDASTSKDRYTVTFTDRTKWISDGPNTSTYNRPIVKIADPSGNYINLAYTVYTEFFGPEPRLTQISDSAGSPLLTLTLDTSGNITAASDRYSRSVYYHIGTYNTVNVPTGWQQFYPEVDQVSEIVPTGTSTPPLRFQYGYQNFSNLEGSETVPFLHTITVPSPTGTGTSTTTISYSSSNDMVSSIVDGNGNQRIYTVVDSLHTKVSYETPTGTVVYSYIAGFSSNMAKTSAANGSGTTTTSWAYSDPNDPNCPSTETDAFGHSSSLTYDAYGHILTETNPYGVTTTYTFVYTTFPLGELSTITRGGHTVATYGHAEPSGLINSLQTPTPGTTGGASFVTNTAIFDSLGNETSVTRPGNNAGTTLTGTASYTTDGTYTQADAIGQPIKITTAAGRVTHMRYDSRGNKLSETDGLGNETDYTYNLADQQTSVIFPATGQTGTGRGHIDTSYLYVGGPPTTSTTYDESGTAVRQATLTYGQEGETLGISGEAETQTWNYDAAYRVHQQLDGNGHGQTYAYNTAGFLGSVTHSDGSSRSFTSYDTIGDVLSRTDERGVVTNFVYSDAMNQLTDIQYPASTALNVHNTYDTFGHLSGWTDGSGSVSYTFDDNGLWLTVTQSYTGGPSKTFTNAYYPDGMRSSMTVASGQTFSYTYNADDQFAGETNPAGLSWTWDYLTNGWLWRQNQTNNSIRTEYTLNARGLPTEVDNYQSATSTVLSDFASIHYDGAANLSSVTASIPLATSLGGTTTFTRNSQDEITQETSTVSGGYSNSFGYDSALNPTTLRGTTKTYNTVNQPSGVTFDASGNQTGLGGSTLAYDAENRMTSFGSALTAGYRADGLRAWKQGSGGKTYYFYYGSRLVMETDASGNMLGENTWGPRGLMARQTSAANLLYTFDPAGNTSQQINASTGAVNASFHFDAFGTKTVSGTPVADAYAGFGAQQGYYLDSETNLYRVGVRYFDPSSARFTSRDPIGVDGGMNLYAYCGNDPYDRLDSTGNGWWNIFSDLENFGAKCLNGGLSSIGSIIGSMFDGGSHSISGDVCNAAGYCLSAMLHLVEDAGGPVAGCILGAVGSLMGNAISFACQAMLHPCKPPKFDGCTALSWGVNALMGCASGMAPPGLGFLLGLLGNMLSSEAQSMCQGSMTGGPPSGVEW